MAAPLFYVVLKWFTYSKLSANVPVGKIHLKKFIDTD